MNHGVASGTGAASRQAVWTSLSRRVFWGFLILLGMVVAEGEVQAEELVWGVLPPFPAELGVAGPFVGVHGDWLIAAGGANFPEPVWESEKVWHDAIFALNLREPEAGWREAGRLPRPLGYGLSVNVPEGVACFGGNDAEEVYAEGFLLSWTGEEVRVEPLPALPGTSCYGAGAWLGGAIYVVGGSRGLELETAERNFWRLDWARRGEPDQFRWEELEAWPGPERALAFAVSQGEAGEERLWVMGGRRVNEAGETEFLDDVHEFDPGNAESPWRTRAKMPLALAAGAAGALGRDRIFLVAGADGALFHQTEALRDRHPGFPRGILAYDRTTDRWTVAGEMPQNQVTTPAVPWGKKVLLVSGELRPRVRTKAVWQIELRGEKAP